MLQEIRIVPSSAQRHHILVLPPISDYQLTVGFTFVLKGSCYSMRDTRSRMERESKTAKQLFR